MKHKVFAGILLSSLIHLFPTRGLAQWGYQGSDIYYNSGSVIVGRTVADGAGTVFGKAQLEVSNGYSWLQGIVLGWLSPVAVFSTDNPKEWDFDQGGTQIAQFTAGGNFLIGKTSQQNSSYKLDVNGNVRANQVTVNTSGADFVFDSSYHLPSLHDVSSYIAKNHHLEGIASAKEMTDSGINLGNNQIQLLKKIEELTLYTIDQDKKIKDQDSLLQKQQRQIDMLIKRLDQQAVRN